MKSAARWILRIAGAALFLVIARKYFYKRLSEKEAPIRSNFHVLSAVRNLPIGGSDVIFDQPWALPPVDVHRSVEEVISNKSRKIIISSMTYSHGLGNLMFQFAALAYFAREFNASLLLPADCLLRRAFAHLPHALYVDAAAMTTFLEGHESQRLQFKACCTFEPHPPLFVDENWTLLDGYFQDYRYFHPHRGSEIRKAFEFLPDVNQRANVWLERARLIGKVLVGVHARHGMDITLHSRNLRHGHVHAPADYFMRAARRIRQQLGDDIVFLVVSDDKSWAQRYLKEFDESPVVFVDGGTREVDLAVLAACDATILSTGTFGWWAAFLAHGAVVRFADWPRPGSALHSMVAKSHYFPAEWLALS